MKESLIASHEGARYELRFRALSDKRAGYAFACDASGHVDMAALTEKARNNYFYARTLIGREFFSPAVEFSAAH